MGQQSTITPRQCSFSGDAVLTTNYDSDGVVRGKAFLFEKNITMLTGATTYILFDYTTYTKSGSELGLIYVLPPFFSTTAGPVYVNVYRGTDYSGGTPFSAINPNTLNAKTAAETTLTLGPTGTTKGTLSMEYLVGGAAQGNQSASGSATGIEFFIRNNTQKTLVEILNQSGSAITFHYSQVLYEI